MNDIKAGVLFWIIMFCIAALVGLALSGCTATRIPDPYVPGDTEILTVIKNINWIQGILIIGIVGSIFACFNGAAKIGIPLLISSLVGYGLTSAMLFYAKLIAMMSLIGGVGLCGYMIFIKHRALKEIIHTIDYVREKISFADDAKLFRNDDAYIKELIQHPQTTKIVKKIKGKINGNA